MMKCQYVNKLVVVLNLIYGIEGIIAGGNYIDFSYHYFINIMQPINLDKSFYHLDVVISFVIHIVPILCYYFLMVAKIGVACGQEFVKVVLTIQNSMSLFILRKNNLKVVTTTRD